MTVILDSQKLLVVSAPKVACTSIKTALFEVENGFEFRAFHTNGIYRHIHDTGIYPAVSFEGIAARDFQGYLKLTMVRDPVRRLLSAYSNRVLHYRELSEKALGAEAIEKGVKPDPDLHEFVANLKEYRQASRSIMLHTEPLWVFLGRDPSFYDQIFNIKQIPEFDERISSWIGRPYLTPHLQTGGPKLDVADLTASERTKLENFYSLDYNLYGEYIEK